MIHDGSSTLKEAVYHRSQADDRPDRINIMEEAFEPAPTSENLGIVAEATSPHYSETIRTATTDGVRRDPHEPCQLPDEILVEIIHCAASNPRIDRYTDVLSDPTLLPSLTSYREVCKRWKILIDGTPSLWAFLSPGDVRSVEAFQRVIDKSGNAPSVISCGQSRMGLQHSVYMVTLQMHRCKVLWIRPGLLDRTSKVRALLTQPCPILEELHFDPRPWWGVSVDGVDSNTGQISKGITYYDIWALRHNSQRLKVLSLGKVTGWRTGSKLTNLRELKLAWPRIEFEELMESLTESPLLRILTINHSLWDMYLPSKRATVVELAFLTRIELQDASASFTHSLLSHINSPSLKQLFIQIRDFNSPLFPLGDVGPACQALFLSLMKAQGTMPIPIEVEINYQRLSVVDNQTGRKFELSARGIWPDGRLIHFMQSLSNITRHWSTMSTPSFSLLLGETDPDLVTTDIHITQGCLRSLMDIDGITEIRLGDMADNVQGVYQLLSYPVREDQPPRWLLPRLAILEIEEHQCHDTALVQMLEARYATTVTGNGDTLAPLPLSLLKLVRHSSKAPEPQIAEKIRNIIGAEHFQLEVY